MDEVRLFRELFGKNDIRSRSLISPPSHAGVCSAFMHISIFAVVDSGGVVKSSAAVVNFLGLWRY